jgi:hypothetical protein
MNTPDLSFVKYVFDVLAGVGVITFFLMYLNARASASRE